MFAIIVMITPYDNCNEKNPKHFISEKTWLLIWNLSYILQIPKEKAAEHV